MEYIVNAAEAAKIDRISIYEIGIPSVVLMEKAAMALARCASDACGKYVQLNCNGINSKPRILAVCGTGNNGGDGAAAARLLNGQGYSTDILLAGSKEKMSEEMRIQVQIAEKLGIRFITKPEDNEYTVIIDALFGTGLSRDIEGVYAEWIHWINSQHSVVIATDIPSGINADNGKVCGCAVKAEYTVTFGFNKRGIIMFPGALYSGKVITEDIGFPDIAVQKAAPGAYTYNKTDIEKLVPERMARTNKGSFGKVLVIAGSKGMSGACFLAAKAAYRMGCGLVKIATAEQNTDILKIKLPEAITGSYENGIIDDINWADVIAIGPGIGTDNSASRLVSEVLKIKDKPVVMDADAINILPMLRLVKSGYDKYGLGSNFIITPHLKEMSRLTGAQVQDIQENIIEYASCHKDGCTVVLKDARTVVSDGKKIYINTTGNNALSTGGSGDVLCGMAAGLLAQGMEGIDAAALAVFVHGLAAESYTRNKSRNSMVASDIIEELPYVLPF